MKLSQFMTMLSLNTDVHLTKVQAAIIRRKIEFLQQARDALDKTLARKINQSAEIEQVLLDMATGKLPLPSKQDCRILALRLGTPKSEWNEQISGHQWEGEPERDALAAQVAGIKDEISDFLAALDGMMLAGLDCEEIANDLEQRLSNYDAPQQHLAEIRAEAVLEFKSTVINELDKTVLVAHSGCRGTDASDLDDVKVINTPEFIQFANQYADSILKGGVG